jgi:hypothetical protein
MAFHIVSDYFSLILSRLAVETQKINRRAEKMKKTLLYDET